jgi:hypothetical protein
MACHIKQGGLHRRDTAIRGRWMNELADMRSVIEMQQAVLHKI